MIIVHDNYNNWVKMRLSLLLVGLIVLCWHCLEAYRLPDKTLSFYGPRDLDRPNYVAKRDGHLMSKKQALYTLIKDNQKAHDVLNDLSIAHFGRDLDMDYETSIPYVHHNGNNLAVLNSVNTNQLTTPAAKTTKNAKVGLNVPPAKKQLITTPMSRHSVNLHTGMGSSSRNDGKSDGSKVTSMLIKPVHGFLGSQVVAVPRTVLTNSMVLQPQTQYSVQQQDMVPAVQPSISFPVDSQMQVAPQISIPVQPPTAVQPSLPQSFQPRMSLPIGQPTDVSTQLGTAVQPPISFPVDGQMPVAPQTSNPVQPGLTGNVQTPVGQPQLPVQNGPSQVPFA